MRLCWGRERKGGLHHNKIKLGEFIFLPLFCGFSRPPLFVADDTKDQINKKMKVFIKFPELRGLRGDGIYVFN